MGNIESDPLAEYFADDDATAFLAKAESDPDAARDALLIAAGYIRRGDALPGNLAEHLAGAIEAAMAKPEKLRAKALTDELNLTANNARPAGDWAHIGCEAEELVRKGLTQEKAFGKISNKYDMSEITVRRYFRQCDKAQALIDADLLKRGIKPPPNYFKAKK